MANSNRALQKYQAALQRVHDHAMGIYGLLDKSRGPVKVAEIKQMLKINDYEYRRARQHLATIVENVYITHDGLVLSDYVDADDYDVRLWHLACDFGILKWSTSAVCFGPPAAQQTSTLDLSVSLSLEAGVGLESQGGVIRADSSGI